MTKREGAVLSAFTGLMIGAFNDFHQYVEEILSRPVFTHELAIPSVMEEIKEKSTEDFFNICKTITE